MPKVIKSRFTFADAQTNVGKCLQLEALHSEYLTYLNTCITLLIQNKQSSLAPSAMRTFFPSSNLSSQIAKNIQHQAVEIINTWTRALYGRKLSKFISKDKTLTDQQRMELRCCGKYGVSKPGKFGRGSISPEMVALYWSWVWDETVSGKPPAISDRIPMVMSEMTCVFGLATKSKEFPIWLRFSSLQAGRRTQIPLKPTPYLLAGLANDTLSKTVTVSKTRKGQWRFQFSENAPDPVLDGSKGSVGVDVGLNCLAATSNGRLYGHSFKPIFDKTYKKVKDLRANRQRQGLKENSPRLNALEAKLSGQIKTATGTVANQLVKSFPGHTFVVEDLDLRGCRGQKRFAYRALQKSLASKAVCQEVNPAYTSQQCPSCGHVSRGNRKGIDFCCTGCGKKGHADVAGATNLLRRSGDKQIRVNDRPFAVKHILRTRYLLARKSQQSCEGLQSLEGLQSSVSKRGCRVNSAGEPASLSTTIAPVPSGRELTVKVLEYKALHSFKVDT